MRFMCLFVAAALQLNRPTIFKLLGACFRRLTQSFKLLVCYSGKRNKRDTVAGLIQMYISTCASLAACHMCDDGLIVK